MVARFVWECKEPRNEELRQLIEDELLKLFKIKLDCSGYKSISNEVYRMSRVVITHCTPFWEVIKVYYYFKRKPEINQVDYINCSSLGRRSYDWALSDSESDSSSDSDSSDMSFCCLPLRK